MRVLGFRGSGFIELRGVGLGGSGFRVGLGFRVYGLSRVQGCRVEGFMVWGFRVFGYDPGVGKGPAFPWPSQAPPILAKTRPGFRV